MVGVPRRRTLAQRVKEKRRRRAHSRRPTRVEIWSCARAKHIYPFLEGGAGGLSEGTWGAAGGQGCLISSTIMPARWQADAAATTCSACHNAFTLLNRRHHCRRCGHIFCGACSGQTALVEGYAKVQRVCNGCKQLPTEAARTQNDPVVSDGMYGGI
jgi:hypothetical protein